MAREFTFNGVSSGTYNCYVADSNFFNSPAEDVEAISIPGSNAIYYLSEGTFKPFTLEFNCYIKGDMQTKVPALRQVLQSQFGVVNIYDTLDTSEFREGRYINSFVLGTSDKENAALKIEFLTRPEKFLVSGSTSTTYTGSRTITNPTLFPAKPIIRMFSTGTLTVNGYPITVNSINEYVDIDCEKMQCYKGTTNCNANVTVDEFPILKSGSNTITASSTSLRYAITPRWWHI